MVVPVIVPEIVALVANKLPLESTKNLSPALNTIDSRFTVPIVKLVGELLI
jgi:hypothetical protein